MRLRSGNSGLDDCMVDIGHKGGSLKRVKIPDLNLNDEGDVLSEEGGDGDGDECDGMEVGNEERAKGLLNNGNGGLKVCSQKSDQASGVSVSRGEKSYGILILANEASRLSSEALEEGLDRYKSLAINEQKPVCQDEEKPSYRLGVGTSGIDLVDDNLDLSLYISLTRSENGKHNSDGKKGCGNCETDLGMSSNSNAAKHSTDKGSVIEDSESGRSESGVKEGLFKVLGKVLRSRIVPANGLGEEAGKGETIVTPTKRKRESTCQSNEETVKVNNLQLESIDDDANDVSLISSENKRKRGRPKKSTDHPFDPAVHVHQAQIVSEIEDENMGDITTVNTIKDSSDVLCKGENEAGEASKKPFGSSTALRKSERSKKGVEYCEKQAVERKISVCKIEYESENKDKAVNNMKDESSSKKAKRGRPKKQDGSSLVKMVLFDDCHGVPQKATVRVPSVEGTFTDIKRTSAEPELHGADTSSKGEETLKQDNNLPVKCNKGETSGSIAAEKNLIRNQIMDMLLRAGWTIEYRPRNGREYNDTVYVNRKGQTHWSVTKAYFSLQKEFEEGKAGSEASNSKFSFTPLPEEVLSRLFRVVSKTRSDKDKKKKQKGDGNSSDEVIRDKSGSKTEGRNKHSALKRKSSVRDGTQCRRRCALVARSSKGLNSERDEDIAYLGKNSVFAWLIDSDVISLNDKVQYMDQNESGTKLEGSITRDGIHCHCCKKVISVFEFKKHSGRKLGQPYENLYLGSGVSLIKCMLDSWNKQDSASLKAFHSLSVDGDDPNDDTCAICGDGGDLMCCDSCPSTFHHNCLRMEEVPSGEWHCVFCSCKFCGTHVIGDYDEPSSSLVTCCLCEKKYHLSCADEEDLLHAKSGSTTFCGNICEQIFKQLQTLTGTKRDLGDGFSWTLLQRYDVEAPVNSLEDQKIENNSKLAVALSVMDECFVPIIDLRSRINMIRHVVYNSGSNLMRINFSSFFTIVLEKGDEVISAASIRIHGKQLAEMPFIGTRNIFRRQGMCRRLLTAIELALGSLGIENLVIPAIPELMDTWTSIFGFQPLKENIREEMRSMNLLVFAHTDMLLKPLSKQKLLDEGVSIIENNANGTNPRKEQIDGGPAKSEVDNGSFNVSFDLNVVAPGVPESSSDERPADCNTENCGAEVKSGSNLEELDDADIAEGQTTPMGFIDRRVESTSISGNTSEGCLTADYPVSSCEEKGMKIGSKPEIHEPSIPFSQSATVVSSNSSLLTVASVTRVSSESSCNTSSNGGESSTTDLCLGNDVPKVGSN